MIRLAASMASAFFSSGAGMGGRRRSQLSKGLLINAFYQPFDLLCVLPTVVFFNREFWWMWWRFKKDKKKIVQGENLVIPLLYPKLLAHTFLL